MSSRQILQIQTITEAEGDNDEATPQPVRKIVSLGIKEPACQSVTGEITKTDSQGIKQQVAQSASQ